jgi:DNA-binding NtrC family response regulator
MTRQAPVVMVVDDEAPVRTSIAARLDLEGYTVVEARNCSEAIDILRRQTVDAVISDVRMPGYADGAGLVGWIANNAPATAAFLISGRRCPENVKRMLPETPFFQKPFPIERIVSALADRVGARQQYRGGVTPRQLPVP